MLQFISNLLRRGPRQYRTQLPSRVECDWIAIDFETANETRGSACAVGVAMMRDGCVVAQGETLINPEEGFSPYNTMVHGLDAQAVRGAPTFPEVWRELAPLLEGQSVVAHNLSFDLGVLRATASRYGLPGVTFDGYCTYRMAKMTWPGLESYSLGWLAMTLGLDDFDHHDAGDDATASAWLASRICAGSAGGLSLTAERLGFRPATITAESYIGFHLLAGLGSKKPTAHAGNPDADPAHPLFGHSVCFTGGLLSMPRREACDEVCLVGAEFKNSVGKKLDYLVIGDADFVAFADGWATGKLTKARELIADGAAIEIIPEREFLALLRS